MHKVLRFMFLAALIGSVAGVVFIAGCSEDCETLIGPEPVNYDDYIVYVGPYGIMMMDETWSGLEIIALGDPDSLLTPVWSPQKTEVVYVRITGSGEKQIEVYQNNGSIDTLAMGMIDKSPWSPDGTKIAYTNNDSVFVIDTGGSHPVSLMASAGEANFLDNGHIVCRYFFGDWQTGSIYKVPVSGGAAVKLSSNPETGFSWLMCPRVMPGGDSVVFVQFLDDNWSYRWNDFWIVDADGSDERTITRIYTSFSSIVLVTEMDVSSGGDYMLLVHNEAHANRYPYEIYIPTGATVIIDTVECASDIRSIDYAPDSRDFVFEKETGGIAIFDRSAGKVMTLDPLGKHPNW